MRHTAIAFWLTCLLVLGTAVPVVGGVATLTPCDTGIIRNPEMPNDSRFLLRFEPPAELRGAQVDLAILEFTAAVSCPDSTRALTIDAFAVTSSWDGQSVAWSDGWDAPGGDVDRGVHAVWTVAPGDDASIRFDVTEMMAGWLRTGRDNCGLMACVARGEVGAFSPRRNNRDTAGAPMVTVWYTPRSSK